MATFGLGSRDEDSRGLELMLGDSHTAANTFGLTGSNFQNVPKSKFLYYVKFHRSNDQIKTGIGNDWDRGLGLMVKSVDRPRIQFKTETLNQYNRKRVVQTTQDFEPVQFRFYDTVSEIVLSMFTDYYQYYYSNSYMEEGGSSVYDVVTAEGKDIGKWGFRPPLADQNYGYFFSHITVYQLFSGYVSQFDLINPKIRDFNPDEFEAAGTGISEIQMSFEYENIVFYQTMPVPDDLIQEMGLDKAQYWNVEMPGYETATYGFGNGNPAGNINDAISNVLTQNLASLITGQGTQSVGGIVSSIAGQFDANRGLAVGNTAFKSLKSLVSGDTSSAKQGVQGLLKGTLFGTPGKFF